MALPSLSSQVAASARCTKGPEAAPNLVKSSHVEGRSGESLNTFFLSYYYYYYCYYYYILLSLLLLLLLLSYVYDIYAYLIYYII